MHPLGCISGDKTLAAKYGSSLNLFTPGNYYRIFIYMDFTPLSKPEHPVRRGARIAGLFPKIVLALPMKFSVLIVFLNSRLRILIDGAANHREAILPNYQRETPPWFKNDCRFRLLVPVLTKPTCQDS